MKKKITMIVAVFCMAILAVSLIACNAKSVEPETQSEHKHSFSETYTFDNSSHWQVCTATDCNEIKNISAHTYDEGVEEAIENSASEVEIIYTCTVCGQTKFEKHLLLNENTDFENLKSEKVSEEEWKNAFSFDNITIKYNNTDDTYITKITEEGINHKAIYISGEEYDEGFAAIWECANKIYYYENSSEGIFTDIGEKGTEDYETYKEIIGFYHRLCYVDFSKCFSSFVYDEEKGSYILTETVKANSIFEDWNVDHKSAELKFINGKVVYMVVFNDEKICLYDEGKTTIEQPAIE